MRSITTNLALFLALACAPACQTLPQTPEGREHLAVATYAEAVQLLTDLRRADKIGDSEWQTIKEAIAAARGTRRALKSARETGASESTVTRLLNAAASAMQAVIQMKEEQTE